ncbi:MAG: hypothetical protein WBE88_10980, partial [Candidatus Acidiferrales bacterium]
MTLGIRKDGSVESAIAVSGPPLLHGAALASAQQSQFECHKCDEEVTSYRLFYSFRLVVLTASCIAPEDCGKSVPIQHAPEVTQSEDHITLVNETAPTGICDGKMKVRSLKCL